NDIQTIEGARTISFVDINQDKKPDIIASGTTEVGDSDSSFVSVLLNVSVDSNNKPTPPTILESFAISNRAIFNWGAGSDDIAPEQTLQYNLSISRVLDENETKALIPEVVAYNNSNVGTRLIKEFTNIPWGNYQWKVQTIDPSGIISEWSEEKKLFIPRLVKSFQSIPGYSYGISRWSDINDDELLDLAITGNLYTGSSKTQIYLNDDGILNVDNLQPRMANVYGGHLSFVDYNNDGFLDISMTGIATINFSTFTALLLYKYENGNFVLDEQENQLSASSGYWGGQYNHDWGDYDNDGDLDLVSGGISIFDNTNYLNVFNNSNGLLSIDTTQTDLVPLFPSAVFWIDINRDNHLDLLALGRLGSDGISHMYINDGTGNLTLSSEQPFSIPSTLHAISVGDYNNDSFDDIAVAHLDGSNMHTNIYTNENGIRFTLQQELEGATYSSLDWGDYDNDGDLDLVSSGYTGTLITDLEQTEYINPITNIYQQNENGQFILDSSLYMLDSVGLSSTQWGDYDNDGDLDLLVTGETEEKELITRVYENLEGFTNPNSKPTKPIMLLSDVNIDSVYISWQGGIDTDNQNGSGRTSDIALKYQLQMGEDQNYSLAGNTHSIISGKYGTGRMGSRSGTSHVINSLPEGRYQWRVRSIDHSLGSSEWSDWDYYYIDQTPPKVDTIQVNYGVGGQIIIIVNFKEEFEMNNSSEAEPFIYAVHPDMNDIDGDQISDTLVVVKQSYSATVWTGLLSLPDNYIGKSIKLHISNAKDMRGNVMKHSVYFKTPQKIISQAGGSVISSDGNVSILFPQNAVNEDVSISINPLIEIAAIDTNLISNFYTISPSDLELKKPTIIRIAVPTNEMDDNQGNQNLHIRRLNIITGEKTTIGGSIISVNGTPYLQSQLSQLGVFAAFKSDSTISVDSLKTDKIICQPRIFSPAGSVFEFPHTNILFDLPSSDNVTARIFNVSGKIKRTLKPEQKLGPGSNVIVWDGKDFDGSVVPSGLYIVTLESSASILRTTVGVLNR
ncbi:MAG: FG-GAP-like repeat-containing protein, partial [Candidatus Neomarinimicrobiota bacterium]